MVFGGLGGIGIDGGYGVGILGWLHYQSRFEYSYNVGDGKCVGECVCRKLGLVFCDTGGGGGWRLWW